jgi:hypothetical protein
MADHPPNPDTGVRPTEDRPPSTPRWVKVFGIIVLVLVLLFVISLLAGVRHGPGLHTPSGGSGGHAPPSSVIEDYTPPGGDLGGHAWPKGGYL